MRMFDSTFKIFWEYLWWIVKHKITFSPRQLSVAISCLIGYCISLTVGGIYFWQPATELCSHTRINTHTPHRALCAAPCLSCLLAVEFGSWGINRAFVFVISSLSPSGHILQARRRGSRGGGGGGGVGLDGGQRENESPFPVRRPQIPLPQPVASQPQTHRSPGLLHRILSKCRKKTECQGATNGAFEGD